MNKKIFFLDDDKRRHGLVQSDFRQDRAYTVNEAKKMLSSVKYDICCLDHDLSGRTNVESGVGTGFEVAEYIIENQIEIPYIIIHSLNKKGSDKMFGILNKAGYNVYQIKITELIEDMDYWKEHFAI